jgi:hypothetical protein
MTDQDSRRSSAWSTRSPVRSATNHFDGDGCVDPELPLLKLAGAILLKPDVVPKGIDGTYAEICARLGVNARSEGWAIWNTWATKGEPIT